MANLSGIVKQLKQERDRVERHLSALNAAITAFVNAYGGSTKPRRKRPKMSAKARAKISAAQKARWAKAKGQQQGPKPGKRRVSAKSRAKMAAAQRARWAKVRKQKS